MYSPNKPSFLHQYSPPVSKKLWMTKNKLFVEIYCILWKLLVSRKKHSVMVEWISGISPYLSIYKSISISCPWGPTYRPPPHTHSHTHSPVKKCTCLEKYLNTDSRNKSLLYGQFSDAYSATPPRPIINYCHNIK